MKSSLRYTGKVSITLGKRRSTAYNKGTDDLFLLFAHALIGDNMEDEHPTEFIIVDQEGNKLESVSIQRKDVVETSVNSTKSIGAKFSGYLTKQIDSPTRIRLCKNSTIYAEVNLDESDIETLSSVTAEKSALIEWELNVSNNT